MKRLPGCLLLLLLALCVATARAQRQPALGIAFYDLDGLYDTIPALFYDDSDHTPRGRLAWDSERYRRKIAHTAAVIDSTAWRTRRSCATFRPPAGATTAICTAR